MHARLRLLIYTSCRILVLQPRLRIKSMHHMTEDSKRRRSIMHAWLVEKLALAGDPFGGL